MTFEIVLRSVHVFYMMQNNFRKGVTSEGQYELQD